MPKHDLARETQLESELAHFVLEQLAQRLEQLQVKCLRQPADVVMRFDAVRFAGLGARRLDDVWIDRALCEPFDVLELRRFSLENVDEQAADDLALLLGIIDPFESGQKFRAGVDMDHAHTEIALERIEHLLGFVLAQQAVVDEHAGELIADRLVDQRRGNRRINATRHCY